jgi:rSAM/selenodomain-associated transferase 2
VAVSVVIPALNEAQWIGAAIDAARQAGAGEILVADGGSADATAAIARDRGAEVLVETGGRARQLNRGAEAARHDVVLFVHADTLLPAGAAEAVERAIAAGHVFGGFRVRFVERSPRLSYVAFMINLRTRLTRQPWGDQAQFVSRDVFRRVGGYPDFPIMEDYELARRMKAIGPAAVLDLTVRTSGRRFLRKGVIRTSILNWTVIAAYHLGVSPERLATWYRR